jgi:hypothetical protein
MLAAKHREHIKDTGSVKSSDNQPGQREVDSISGDSASRFNTISLQK